MKHIKLFEQFEDIDDPFGEEIKSLTEPPVMKLGKYVRSSSFYIVSIVNERVILYDHERYAFSVNNFDFNVQITDNDDVTVFNYNGNMCKFKYKDLPQEIKDQLT